MIDLKNNPDIERHIPFLLEHSSQLFAIGDPNGKILFVNNACCLSLGYTEEELLSMDWVKELTVPGSDSVEHEKLFELHNSSEPVRYEKEYICKNGSHIPVELLVHLARDDSGAPLFYYSFVTNITERKLAEKKLQQSIIEKEILMKELQHRVKNNLNIVASLLCLETEKLHDAAARDVFINARSRILSLSSIYEKLYSSDQIGSIDLYTYITDLAESISETYVIDRSKIIIISELEHIHLDLKRAVPVGLIVNELISNALKYAYPEKNSGKILISTKKHNDSATLNISDYGVGLPADFNIENNSSMGFTLVSLLTDQIGGKLNIDNIGGTSVNITFKV